MDVVNFLGVIASFVVPFVCYFVFFKTNNGRSTFFGKDLFYPIKMYYAVKITKAYQKKCKEKIRKIGIGVDHDVQSFKKFDEFSQTYYLRGSDHQGNSINLKFIKLKNTSEVHLILRLSNGSVYTFPTPGGSNFVVTSTKNGQWKMKGLLIESLEPFKRLRIVFNGLLRDITHESYEQIEHIQFNFIFNVCSSPQFYPQDPDTNLLANSLAAKRWTDASWKDFYGGQNIGYDQFGSLMGVIKGDAIGHDLVLNLPACRSKYFGKDDRLTCKRIIKIFMVDSEGILIDIVLKILYKDSTILRYGYVIQKNNLSVPISELIIDPQAEAILLHEKNHPKTITMDLILQNGSKCKCNIELLTINNLYSVNYSRLGGEASNLPGKGYINDKPAKIILDFNYSGHEINKKIIVPLPLVQETKVDKVPTDILVANISSDHARILELTGGKGNSLALLKSIKQSNFVVPDGFVITVNAYRIHVNASFKLTKMLNQLDDICCGRKKGKLEEVCNEAVCQIKNEPINPETIMAIIKEMRHVKENALKDGIGITRWAVRSSAIGEDSEELSAAGQNDTILGLVTEEDVLKAVSACWASLYAYQSVNYRWQHGLPVISDMAVVVQKMVPSDSAGVLFTWHPTNSNPSQMVITANFGLGESVVSGKSEPDTFILNRTYDDQICLLDHHVGGKQKIIKMTASGIEEVATTVEEVDGFEILDGKNLSLTKEQAMLLGKVGVLLERAFGDPRDIEWAFYKGQLYLLQSRPITTLNAWSDFELTHEFDSPVLSNNNVFTVANVAEVFQGAVTVLTQSSNLAFVDQGLQLQVDQKIDAYANKSVGTFQHHPVIDVVMSLHKNVKKTIQVTSKILDLAIFGHPVINENINKAALHRFGEFSANRQFRETLRAIYYAFNNRKTFQRAVQMTKKLDLNLDHVDSCMSGYEKITKSFSDLVLIMNCHSSTSQVSVFYQIVCISVLLEKNTELTVEHYSDFAAILSTCEDVISAEIPMQLERIGKVVRDEGYEEEFCTLKPEYGIEWLKRKCPEASKLFQKFLDDHGHRLLGEFELMETSWGEDPSKVIPMIQANARNVRVNEKHIQNVDDVIKNLKSPTKNTTRKVVKFLMKKLRVAVGMREHTKSEGIRALNKLRLAYKQLGLRMEKEGIIPSKDLIFHLSHYELGLVLTRKHPLLINKAVRRQRLYPQWNKLKFPEIMYGYPEPEQDDDDLISFTGKSVTGTPVCTGSVKARACVINSLDEIDQLHKGDILITYSTDIGWSPYFPTLSGVVTELGGLVSHGAVVAREYGLPCIVGVKNVTKIFKTGDIVFLSGHTGELGLVEY